MEANVPRLNKINTHMKDNYTHIVILLDESSSMYDTRQATVSGVNEFINSQKLVPGECTMSLIKFSSTFAFRDSSISELHSRTVYSFKPIADAPLLTHNTYGPIGNTPLFDSLCTAIDATGERLAKLDEAERPSQVVFVIVTDGEENSSVQFGLADAKTRITTQTNTYNWKFIYLGANVDSFANAEGMGIGAGTVMNYCQNDAGITQSYSSTSDLVVGLRTGTRAVFLGVDYAAQNQAAGTVINPVQSGS